MNTQTEPQALPAVGDTIYARWAVGPAQRGSGWLDPRAADELDAWTVAETWPAIGTVLVRVPGGGTITIRPGQYLTEERPADIVRRSFRVEQSTHPIDSCERCARYAKAAVSHAMVTGSTGATYGEESANNATRHMVTVKRPHPVVAA